MSDQDSTVTEGGDGLLDAFQQANRSRLPFYDDDRVGRDWRAVHDPSASPTGATPPKHKQREERPPRQPTAAQRRDQDELLRVIAGDFAPQVKRGVQVCSENKLAGSAASAVIIGLSVLALRQMG